MSGRGRAGWDVTLLCRVLAARFGCLGFYGRAEALPFRMKSRYYPSHDDNRISRYQPMSSISPKLIERPCDGPVWGQ